MAIIPGTQLNSQMHLAALREEQKENQAEIDKQQQEQDTAGAKEAKAELDREKQNETEEKNKNDIAEKYRKLGLKLDAQGNTVPISYEEMSPMEQAAHDLKLNQGEAAEARASLSAPGRTPFPRDMPLRTMMRCWRFTAEASPAWRFTTQRQSSNLASWDSSPY